MSFYFQRLIQQSALRVQGTDFLPSPTPFNATPAGSSLDVVEIHEEVTAPPPASSPDPLPHSPMPVLVERPVAKSASAPIPSPVVRPAPSLPAVRELPVAAEPLLEAAPPPPAVGNPVADDPGRPRDILHSVMAWIAAGPQPPPAGPTPARPASLPVSPDSNPVPAATSPAAREIVSPTEEIPSRVIREIEEITAVAPPPSLPPAPQVFAAAAIPIRASLPAADPPHLPRPEPVPETVNVSIGSIHVRVEAPAPPAVAPRATRAASPPPASAPGRPDGFSRLRRHYLLPH